MTPQTPQRIIVTRSIVEVSLNQAIDTSGLGNVLVPRERTALLEALLVELSKEALER